MTICCNIRLVLVVLAMFAMTLFAQATPYTLTFSASNNAVNFSNPPVAITGACDNISHISARIHGTVTTTGATNVQAFFLWGFSSTYGNSTSPQPVPTNLTSQPVSEAISGLTPNTTYHYAIAASSDGGYVQGDDSVFTTPPDYPIVEYPTAKDIYQQTALLAAHAVPGQNHSKYLFRYGSTAGTMNYQTDTVIKTGIDPFWITAPVSGLVPNTTYYFSAVAINDAGSTVSSLGSFSTLASPLEYLPDTNTVALYHFNGSDAAIVKDYSRLQNDGTSNLGLTTGIFGSGALIKFPAPGSVIVPDPNETFCFPVQNFTIEAWVKPNLQGLYDWDIIKKGDATSPNLVFCLTILRDNNITFLCSSNGYDADYRVTTTDQPIIPNRWNHVAVVFDRDNHLASLYHNGQSTQDTIDGSFPLNGLHSSTANLLIGSSSSFQAGAAPRAAVNAEGVIDEVRLSNRMRSATEFTQLVNFISGTVFNDRNANKTREAGEEGLAGWPVSIYTDGGLYHQLVAQTVTDAGGNYFFSGLADGKYFIAEFDSANWLRTIPKDDGYHVILNGSSFLTGKDFGNKFAHLFLGGNLSNPANWADGILPSNGDALIITHNAVFDLPGLDNLAALEVDSLSTLSFNLNGILHITGTLQVGPGGTLTFTPAATSIVINVDGDWINLGSMNPGNSTIIFSGAGGQIISDQPLLEASDAGLLSKPAGFLKNAARPFSPAGTAGIPGNNFHTLVIDGSEVSTMGNITVDDQLVLNNSLYARPVDTVFITADAANAISGTGQVPEGTISRQIHSGSIDQYRFESEGSFIQFNAGSSYPGAITETATPNTVPRSFQLHWEPMGGLVDSVNHTISIEHVTHFSNWSIGRPGGLSKPPVPDARVLQSGFDTNKVIKRLYKIIPDGNNGQFNAALSLRYDPAELDAAALQADLQLYRGPYAVNALEQGWNMISLPVVPESSLPPVLFPSMVSQAFSYAGGYHPQTSLNAGTGYWMKFPAAVSDTMLGNDIEQLSIPVQESWNMIGALSYLTDVANISSPDGVSFGPVFGYEHGYKIQDTLKPLHGYWIKADKAGTLLIQAPSMSDIASAKSSRNQPGTLLGELQHLNSLIIRDAGGNTQTLYFGRSGATANVHQFDMPPLPPQGMFDARFAGNMLAALLPQAGAKDAAVVLSSTQYPVTLSWQITSPVGAGSSMQIGARTTLLGSKTGSATIANVREAADVKLHIEGNGQSKSDVPKEYALHQNYPNPFNPATQISFDLPSASRVQLTIYNILGQEVARVIDGEQFNAGRYSRQVTLNHVAGGVYFYKLTAGAFTSVKKMLLVQ